MRLNGTYLDRLVINILPIIFIGSALICFIKQTSLKSNLIAGLIFTFFLWMIDSYVIYRRRPKSLILTHALFLDDNQVSAKDIEDIRKITYKPGRFWTWDYFVFTIKTFDGIKTINVIEKPLTLAEMIMGKKSKTLTPLFNRFPELKEKYTHHTTIHSLR